MQTVLQFFNKLIHWCITIVKINNAFLQYHNNGSPIYLFLSHYQASDDKQPVIKYF